MNDKPRIGRPKGDGTYKMIGVYGTQHEIDAVLELTPRQRLEAMLATILPIAPWEGDTEPRYDAAAEYRPNYE